MCHPRLIVKLRSLPHALPAGGQGQADEGGAVPLLGGARCWLVLETGEKLLGYVYSHVTLRELCSQRAARPFQLLATNA